MALGQWSSRPSAGSSWEDRDPHQDVSPDAFMEELCMAVGGYGRFFWILLRHYYGWWVAVITIPALFLDHHRCETRQPYTAWALYSAIVLLMLLMAVLLELSVVQRIGLLKAGELHEVMLERRWQLPLLGTLLWKLDAYTDIAFVFIAKDCGSSLWWASMATFVFGVVFGQLLLNTCFACTDCDNELPTSFGFVLLDFKLVNTAVRSVLPFDPDASPLPVPRAVTVRTTTQLISLCKAALDVAQVSIQYLFLRNVREPHSFVVFSILVGILHGLVSLGIVLRDCVQDGLAAQGPALQLGTALQPTEGLPPGSDPAGALAPKPPLERRALRPAVIGRLSEHEDASGRCLEGDHERERHRSAADSAAGGQLLHEGPLDLL